MDAAINLLEEAILQRRIVLALVETEAAERARMSDNGWLLTLGAPQFGMLMAVMTGSQSRRLSGIAQTLRSEIAVLSGHVSALKILHSPGRPGTCLAHDKGMVQLR